MPVFAVFEGMASLAIAEVACAMKVMMAIICVIIR